MKPLLTLAILLLLSGAGLNAQESTTGRQARLLTSFPFRLLTGGIVIITATIDQYPDTLNFVFDTGSGGISLDSATAVGLNIATTASSRTIKGIAGTRQVDFAYNHTLNLPGLSVTGLDFHINNYELLTSVYGIRIDGIVGYSFLRRYIVGLNYDTHTMQVFTPGNYNYIRGGHFLYPNFSTLPMQQLQVKDARSVMARYYMDSGAGLCMLFSRSFIKDSGLLHSRRKPLPTQAEGIGGKKSMEITVIKEVKLGPYRFRKVPVYIFDDEFNVTAYPLLGGLLGNDILRRFNVVINYPDQLVHIKPNNSYTEHFDYAYTGLSMYLIDGHIKVIDIIKDSPADKAGFKQDDIVISLDNHFAGDIQLYKTLLQRANTTCQVVVSRDGKLIPLKLHIKSILKR